MLAHIRSRILRHLDRHGLLDGDHSDSDPIGEQAPVVASCYATSIGDRQTLGPRRGTKLQRIGADPRAPWVDVRGPLQARLDGFDLHAALTVQAQRQEGRLLRENLLRYCARPPIADEPLQALEDGRIALKLKTPWHDGTTHVVGGWMGYRGDSRVLRCERKQPCCQRALQLNAAARCLVVYDRSRNTQSSLKLGR